MAGVDWSAPVQRQAAEGSVDAPRQVSEDATIAGPAAAALSPRQLATAQARNQHWARRLNFTPADFGSAAAVGSAEFARDVARFQREHGLQADGIAGPKTHRALGADQLDSRRSWGRCRTWGRC